MLEKKDALHKDVHRLVRFAVGRQSISVKEAGGILEVQAQDCAGLRIPVAAFAFAVSQGLLLRGEGRTCHAAPEARAFLRRALLDTEDAHAAQHRDIERRAVEVGGVRQTVDANLMESPLGAVARLKERSGAAFLPAEAVSAGERLHTDFTRGQLQPCMTMAYEPRLSSKTRDGAGGAVEISDTALAARMRVARAMEAVGPELCGVALDVCCFGKGLETVERERQWPARSAKLMLRTALMALSRHYTPPSRPAAMRSWGESGYRPDADALGTAGVMPAAAPPRP